MVINRVGPLSTAKVGGIIYAVFGLLVGALISLAAMAGALGNQDAGGAAFGAVLGVGAIIFMPLMYGFFGFLSLLIAAALYNVVASAVGGVEIDIQ